MVKILYFAQLADALGTDQEQLDLPEQIATLRHLMAWLRQRGDPWKTAFYEPNLQIMVNRNIVKADAPVRDGDEVAFVAARR